MTIDIADLRAKLAAATPEAWFADCIEAEQALPHGARAVTFDQYRRNDAELIVAAVNALPALLDELERARRERDDLAASLDERWANSDHLAAKYYKRMRVAEKELDDRELHHFEVEQENAALRAAISEALHGGPNEPGGFVMTETPRRILTAAMDAARQAGGAS